MRFTVIFALFLTVCMVSLGIFACKKGISKTNAKVLFGANVGLLFSLLIVTTIVLFSGVAVNAADAVKTTAGAAADNSKGLAYIGAALSTGLATIGAGIAVALTGSAALGALSEDQSLLGKSLIFVGLAEGIAIYGLIISILILG